MKVVQTVAELRLARAALPGPVGFVPTMGYLHEGHLALVRAARSANRAVVASIFVNPRQFGPGEDYASYPRDLERDLALLEGAAVDLVFTPTVEEMYPDGLSITVDVGPVGEKLEGAARPGHFRGVATAVAKLFNLVQPYRAYFGQKDGQQCVVVRHLIDGLAFPVELAIVPTVREPDGLALSSRNVYLNAEERRAASVLSAGLRLAAAAYRGGEREADKLRDLVAATVRAEPLVTLAYVSLADAVTLDELNRVDRPALLSLAARVGRTRLIDNKLLS